MVYRSVCHDAEPCKNGWTDRDAVRDVDSGGPKDPCVTGSNSPTQRDNFEGKRGSEGTLCRELCKKTEPLEIPFGIWTLVGPRNHMLDGHCILAEPCEYDWIVRVWRRCDLMLNYCEHLLLLLLLLLLLSSRTAESELTISIQVLCHSLSRQSSGNVLPLAAR